MLWTTGSAPDTSVPHGPSLLDSTLPALTGPEGDRHHGYWEVQEVEEPRHLVVRDGFADADGNPDGDLPLNEMQLTITALDDGRTRMTIDTVFPDQASMEQVLAMGMEEGLAAAIGQIDAILAEGDA